MHHAVLSGKPANGVGDAPTPQRRGGRGKQRAGAEYLARRALNNEAVRRCRDNARQHNLDREQRLTELQQGTK